MKKLQIPSSAPSAKGRRGRRSVMLTVGALSTVGAVAVAASIGSNMALTSSTAGTSVATLLSQSSTSSSTPSVTGPSTRKTKGLLGARYLDGFHATISHWDAKTNSTMVATLDRGQLSAVSSTSISIAEPNGTTVTETIGSGTKMRGTSLTALEADLTAHRKVEVLLVQRNGSLSLVTTGAALRRFGHRHVQSGATVLRHGLGFQNSIERYDASTKTTITLNLDRGVLTALTSSSISVKEPNGTVLTQPVASTTRFVGASEASLESALSSGQTIHASLVQKNGQLISVRSRRHGVVVTSPGATGSNSQGASTASA